ncbi:signal transduction histidine kinase [Paenibacillus shirakamiensis]|uniref:Heme sensor protein HssS n=1 Tax=Paenibacillus shirakamiensis TaxID=1265935 RepID=A0ABS4JH84_9BACL|nr:HAMP domain-containing sensor histidine kinase [Paenibacillus shirakamiensis]MBP1999919.1 signal transduction histidine kinase [Paenibacillus shirakamiensis]
MIKSLYIRVVLSFLVSVIGGIIIAFFVATWLFEDKLNDNLKVTLLDFGQDIAHIYESFPLQEAQTLVSTMKQLNSYRIRIFDNLGELQAYGTVQGEHYTKVSQKQINEVIHGSIVQVKTNDIDPILVGIPLHTEKGMRALFVEQRANSSSSFIIKWIFNFLMYSLVAGSLLMLIAAIFLIRPIKKLTQATKHIAAGDFNIKLNIKQSGELGTLARSFEEMMHNLQRIEQMRRDFVTNVSHEVRSPLTSISGYAMALKQVNISEQDRSRYLEIIIAEAERMSHMSDSLMQLSMLESQSQQPKWTVQNLDEQIRRVIVAIQPQWTARAIHFELNLRAVSFRADHDQLNQVWMNLIGNSIKFSSEGGRISVSMRDEISNVTIRIADAGIGISEEDQKRIFERFYKADHSHSRKYEGSGLGLSIVKQILKLHQGEVQVDSEQGRGATFIVTLPKIKEGES